MYFYERSYHNLNFGFDQKNHFCWGKVLVQVKQFRTGTRYCLEVWHQFDKRIKTKYQKVLGATSYVCTSYLRKTRRGATFAPPPASSLIGLKMKSIIINIIKTKMLETKHILKDETKYKDLTIYFVKYYHDKSIKC